MSQKPDFSSRIWVVGAPAHDCYPKHTAPDPYAPSCGWWAYGKVGLCLSFGLCPAESHRQRFGLQALGCVPQPQAWLQGGAPVTSVQVGCELEEKERFWSELDEVMESIPMGERVVIGADFNGHVGEGNTGDEVMGKFGVKERNLEGQMVVDFAKRMDMAVVNTYFQKREEHRVTYKSGGRRTLVDYILCRRGNLKEISDCKVVVGESVARQHRMVVCRMTLLVRKTKRSKIEIEKKTKWWKLKKEECCEEFRQKLRQALGGQVVLPEDWETTAEVIREAGRKVLGVSSGRRKEDKETWWWNVEVQDSIQRKRLAKKKRMVVCRMTLLVRKTKRSKIEIEKKTKWWKLKKEECCEEFRQKLRQALGGQVVLPEDWETTAEVIREAGRKVLGVSSGRRKEDKETWWWNVEVQDSIQRKRLAKKKLRRRRGGIWMELMRI
ncbi:hypothetical protein QTP70_004837 [Hemibagrus guttatus]|uniref:Craniofacial development protein 2 n=1 Tax=Hemibagrus guttatus TaxID=175788 RepID=A0AAE0VBE3_9TELE|nr:hypothetical protein QTP70_004837 [Hemibagrus guttatus]